MKIYSHLVAASVASKDDVQVQTSFKHLLFKITGAATTVTEAELKTAFINWTRAGKRGQESIQTKISLYALAEINAAHEGLFVLNDTTFMAMVAVGDGGAIACTADEYVSINFSGFQLDWNVDIFAVDDEVRTAKVIKYVPDAINSKTIQDLDLRGVKSLFLPIAAVAKLNLVYMIIDGNGKTDAKSIQYTPEELLGSALLDNEIVATNSLSAGTSLIHSSEEYYCLEVNDAVRGTIEYNAGITTSIVYVKSELF